ncbi:MAG: hypothetical protein ABJA34_03300 [Pseudonocardiales bacterium]
MNNRTRLLQATDEEILASVEPVRRVTLARVRDSDRADDRATDVVDEVVQETLARTLAVRHRLDRRAVTPYALSVARNLLASEHREQAMYDRHAPRLFEREEVGPEGDDLVQGRAEAAALNAALLGLSVQGRRLVCAKEVEGRDLKALAAETGSSPQALAARMARLRARLRVDYLLNLRGITLPTERCHDVLVGLSLGEVRRRRAASEHLRTCAECAELAGTVESRRRPVAGLLPIGFLVGWWAGLRRWVARHPWQAAGAAAAAVAMSVAVAMALAAHHSAPAPTPVALQSPRSDVVTVHARVLAVPADEGFWIGSSDGRVWVQMIGAGESAQQIRPGLTVTFTGRRVAHGPGYAASVGLPSGPDATALDAQPSHLEVPQTQVRVG